MSKKTNRQIVLVEPSAAVATGHYREKLDLWLRGLREQGIDAKVVAIDPVRDWSDDSVEFSHLATTVSKFGKLLPAALRNYFLMSLCYAKAIRLAIALDCPMFGLSTRGAIPLYFGHLLCGQKRPMSWGSNIMEYREEKFTGKLQRYAFRKTSANGCRFFINLQQNFERLRAVIRDGFGQFAPDPIHFSELDLTREIKKREIHSVLVSGHDNHRRDSIQLLKESGIDEKLRKLVIQLVGDPIPDPVSFQSVADEVLIAAGYLNRDEFTDLFRSADALVVSYSSEFAAGSGNLVLALVCGTPVLSSRFQAALATEQMFGRIGEFFDYGDREGFKSALARLRNWTDEDWSEFKQMRMKLMEVVDYQKVVNCVVKGLF